MEGINSLNCSDLIHLTKLIPIKNKFHHKQQVSYTYPPKNNFPNEKKNLLQPGILNQTNPPKRVFSPNKNTCPKIIFAPKNQFLLCYLKKFLMLNRKINFLHSKKNIYYTFPNKFLMLVQKKKQIF